MDPSLPLWAFPLLQCVKLLAVIGLFVGTSGVFFTDDHQRQQRAAFWLAGPALGVTWVVGFVLAWARNISTLTPWIVGAMLLSLISINAVLYTAGRPGRVSKTTTACAILPLVCSVALMIYRPG